jgi:DNA repair protein RadC
VAERLIGAFGSLAGFLKATPEAIDAALGHDAWVGRTLLAARTLIERGQREALLHSPVDPASPALRRYLATVLSGEREEALHAVFADRRGRYIADERLAAGGIARLEIRLRPLFHRAFELGAGAVLLAHNHPSGDPAPSAADIAATRELVRIAASLDVAVIDHFVVAGAAVTSMREWGLL